MAICYLSRCLESPTQDALVAARRVLRYLHTTKYLGIRYTIGAVANVHGMIRELVEAGVVATKYIPTADNVADILTKPLGRSRFEKLRRLLLNHS